MTYLLRRDYEALQALFRLLIDDILVIPPLDESIADWLSVFFVQYRDQEPQLADASVVFLAEQLGIESIFTLDRRHFSVYRGKDGKAFRLLPEVV